VSAVSTQQSNRIEDVEQDIVLPPVTHETVLLDLDPYAIKAYNAMQAAIAINAIDSERTDQVCVFYLTLLCINMASIARIIFFTLE
jgi:hypothetical protein